MSTFGRCLQGLKATLKLAPSRKEVSLALKDLFDILLKMDQSLLTQSIVRKYRIATLSTTYENTYPVEKCIFCCRRLKDRLLKNVTRYA